MTKYIGPFANLGELTKTVATAKQLFPDAKPSYFLTFEAQAAKQEKAKPKAKGFNCPECGQLLKSPQSMGPHSRKHRTTESDGKGAEAAAREALTPA